jgi:hypothetical protein
MTASGSRFRFHNIDYANKSSALFLQQLPASSSFGPPLNVALSHRSGEKFGHANENFTIQASKFCYVPFVRAGLNGIQKANLIVTDRTRLRVPALLRERKRLGHRGLAVFG